MERSQLLSELPSSKTVSVLAIECIRGTAKVDEWRGGLLRTGDIVEEIRVGDIFLRSPFKNGKPGVEKILHSSFKNQQMPIFLRVRRGRDEFIELQAFMVPNDTRGTKNQYSLTAIDDPNYAFRFLDRTEAECLELQASRSARIQNALNVAQLQLQERYVSYPWERKMQGVLSIANSSCFLSILFLPKSSDRMSSRYNDIEDTFARANAWLSASQASGVPIVFTNIQIESLLTKISGETASSTVSASSLSDLSSITNASLYGFEDYHGVDIGVVQSVRLWYSPIAGEYRVEIDIKQADTKLGFAISRSEEGFIYISSVVERDDDVPSARSGLRDIYKDAIRTSHLLVVSRINNQKVLPWIVSPYGEIRCFDTVFISHRLSLQRRAKVPILLHLLMWDQELASPSGSIPRLTNYPAQH
ncbi:hypothetical protein Nepgr_009429 [Nepenthes gracilis]|uniref:Uncharacterized protein n=1 Tax=Nepenthes gracilis TaxID=150966 RepID=A0AAD3XKB9_NEPGR|nr:hypothetical protein Nepgr_009429 [Nepenthes gracilis]